MKHKKHAIIAFLTALCIATVWTWFNTYEYIGTNIYLFNRINIFPLALWTIGLTSLFVVHTNTKGRFRFLKTSLFYLFTLGILEAFGYYVLNIRLNSHEPSLFNLGIIHAKPHMKVFYVLAGPAYIALLHIIFHAKKNTHSKY